MKGNTEKCHLITSTNNTPELKVGDSLIKTSTCEKLLGVKIDYKLTFDNHVANLCKKANNKLRALTSATPYMTTEKRKLLMNSFFNAQLNYCPLIWMLHSRWNNIKIKHLHDRCLKLIYCDKNLAIEMYKVKDELAPMIAANVFTTITENHYNLGNYNGFRLPFARTNRKYFRSRTTSEYFFSAKFVMHFRYCITNEYCVLFIHSSYL